MSTPKQIDFANAESDDNSPPTSFRLVRKRPRKRNDSDSFAAVKKIKRKKSVIWSEEDEIALLKGLVDYRSKTGFEPTIDWDAFLAFVGDSIVAKVSKDQVMSKLRKLKRKLFADLKRIDGGEDPHFTSSTDSQIFGYAMLIWGNNDEKDNVEQSKNGEENEEVPNVEPLVSKKDQEENVVDKIVQNVITHVNELCVVHETCKENEEVVNFEPLVAENDFNGSLQQHEEVVVDKVAEDVNAEIVRDEDDTHGDELCVVQETSKEVVMADPLDENEANKTDLNGKQNEVAVVDNIPEKVTNEKECHEAHDDELCAVQDAFETMIWQGLSNFQKKKLQLELLANIGAEKRRELSNEWKTICDEARELNIKKIRFAAKLAEIK